MAGAWAVAVMVAGCQKQPAPKVYECGLGDVHSLVVDGAVGRMVTSTWPGGLCVL